MDPGIEIFAISGKDLRGKINSGQQVKKSNIGEWYGIEISEKFFIVTIPKDGSTETNFEIQYRVSAKLLEESGDSGNSTGLIIGISIGVNVLFLIIYLVVRYAGNRKTLDKAKIQVVDVDDEGNPAHGDLVPGNNGTIINDVSEVLDDDAVSEKTNNPY